MDIKLRYGGNDDLKIIVINIIHLHLMFVKINRIY